LRSQIERCRILSPGDGLVFHANEQSPFGPNEPRIEEGATVRERQILFRLPDLSGPMLVDTKVRETMVARIAPGQPVRVKVHAFPEKPLPGVVERVAPLPDPSTFFRSDRKVYSTKV